MSLALLRSETGARAISFLENMVTDKRGECMQYKNDREPLLLEDEALRDGLQIESQIFTIDQKIALFNLLKKAGLRRIQVGSFVHPKIVPQMADSDELIKRLGKQTNTVISALILNSKGLDRALACEVPHVSMSVSVSDNSPSSRKSDRTSKWKVPKTNRCGLNRQVCGIEHRRVVHRPHQVRHPTTTGTEGV